MNHERWWTVTFSDGATERRFGVLTINEDVVWITKRGPYGGLIEEQYAYPLTSLRKWERA